LLRCFVCVGGLAELDEPGVLGEAAGVEVERDFVPFAEGAYCADVFHGDGLAAAGVVGDGEHDERNMLSSYSCDEGFERGNIHVSFERVVQGWLASFRDEEVDGLSAEELDVSARGVEVGVVGDNVAFFASDPEEDAFGGTALVGGDDVGVSDDVVHGRTEAIEAATSCVALVAFHYGRPLMGGHGAGAGVRQQVNEDVVGGEEEKVVMGGFEKLFALGAGCPADRFDALDAERFDDCFNGHGAFLNCPAYMVCPVPCLMPDRYPLPRGASIVFNGLRTEMAVSC